MLLFRICPYFRLCWVPKKHIFPWHLYLGQLLESNLSEFVFNFSIWHYRMWGHLVCLPFSLFWLWTYFFNNNNRRTWPKFQFCCAGCQRNMYWIANDWLIRLYVECLRNYNSPKADFILYLLVCITGQYSTNTDIRGKNSDIVWAVSRENQHYGLCVMYRPRSACEFRAG